MRHSGFTLFELLLVMAIVAILAAVAYPSYAYYIEQTQRQAATLRLLQAAAAMQHYYDRRQSYQGAKWSTLSLSPNDSTHHYQLELAELTAKHFLIQARQQPGGALIASIDERAQVKKT